MKKRIESKTSRTAEFTCMVRCLSYLEKRPQYRSGDYISLVIMNSLMKFLIRLSLAKRLIIDNFTTGMFEYIIARTKYIDEAFKAALKDGAEQVLILGAGFDSRGIRLNDTASCAKIFELDAPVTQAAKIGRYKEKGIAFPGNLIFIPVDFDKQSMSERLTECGFEKNRKSLIIMEGLTMYLQPESVDDLFKTVSDFTGQGSSIVFDFIYTSVLDHKNLYKGEEGMMESAMKNGEAFCYGMEKEDLPGFLSKYDYSIADISDSAVLENRFFKDENGNIITSMNGTHCIITAVKI